MILDNLTGSANSRATIETQATLGDLRMSWIESYNQIEKVENVYASIEDTTLNYWDRILVLTGIERLPHVVRFDIHWADNIPFGSIGLTNPKETPQVIQNQTYWFSYDYSGPLGMKLQANIIPQFTRSFELPSDQWDNPYPVFASDGVSYYAVWYSTETFKFEVFVYDFGLETLTMTPKTLSGGDFYLTQFDSFSYDTMHGNFVIQGNDGQTYISVDGVNYI